MEESSPPAVFLSSLSKFQWKPFSLASHQHLLYDDPLIDHSCFGLRDDSSSAFFFLLSSHLIFMFCIPTLPCLTSPSSFSVPSAFPFKGMSISLLSLLASSFNAMWDDDDPRYLLVAGSVSSHRVHSILFSWFGSPFFLSRLDSHDHLTQTIQVDVCIGLCYWNAKTSPEFWGATRTSQVAFPFFSSILPCFPVHLEYLEYLKREFINSFIILVYLLLSMVFQEHFLHLVSNTKPTFLDSLY